MARTIHITKEPVRLSGFNAILKPSKFGYSLKAIVGEDIVKALEIERAECLEWAESKVKNLKRSIKRPEPWEEVYPGQYVVKFSWKEESKPPVVDTEGTVISNVDLPVYEGSEVKIGFSQKPYILRDGVTYGTSLKLSGIQIVKIQEGASLGGELSDEGVANLFGKTKGFKADDAVAEAPGTPSSVDIEDDF